VAKDSVFVVMVAYAATWYGLRNMPALAVAIFQLDKKVHG
jgi:hypothetical protein